MAAPMDNEKGHVAKQEIAKNGDNWILNIVKRKDFLFGVCGASALVSFCFSLHRVRKQAHKYAKESLRVKTKELPEMFAMKALTMGSLVAVSSFSLFWVMVFKLCGTSNIYEFHAKLRTFFPEKEKQGRTEFANLRELADYLISEDRKAELAKKKKLEESSQKET